MKVPFYMLLLLAIICSTSCKTTIPTEDEAIVLTRAAYKKSLAIFDAGKKEYNNSYTFAISHESWVGFWSKLFFTVKDGKIVARRLLEGDRESSPEGTLKWEENEKTLGSNESYIGMITMDTLYKEAKEYVGKSKKESKWMNNVGRTNYVSMNAEGLITSIGYVPDDCADDCFRGYSVSDFEWTK